MRLNLLMHVLLDSELKGNIHTNYYYCYYCSISKIFWKNKRPSKRWYFESIDCYILLNITLLKLSIKSIFSYSNTHILSSFTQHVKSLQLILGSKEPEFSVVMSKSFFNYIKNFRQWKQATEPLFLLRILDNNTIAYYTVHVYDSLGSIRISETTLFAWTLISWLNTAPEIINYGSASS